MAVMKIVIIGNGMVGYKFCEKLVAKSSQDFDITVFGEEIRPAYDRSPQRRFFRQVSGRTLHGYYPMV